MELLVHIFLHVNYRNVTVLYRQLARAAPVSCASRVLVTPVILHVISQQRTIVQHAQTLLLFEKQLAFVGGSVGFTVSFLLDSVVTFGRLISEPSRLMFNWRCVFCRRVHAVAISHWSCVRMEQLSGHWRDFHEIWYPSIFRNSVEKIQFPLISDKNNGYFT